MNKVACHVQDVNGRSNHDSSSRVESEVSFASSSGGADPPAAFMMAPALPPNSCVVVTPDRLAAAMVSALGDSPGVEWLDPCVGPGAFVSALSRAGVAPTRVIALDIAPAPESNDDCASTLRGVDFLQWSQTTSSRFDRVVGNPPFIAISKLPEILRTVATSITGPDGTLIPASANYWTAFLAAAIRLLRPNGSIALVLPAAWEYADYAGSFRKCLPHLFREFQVHRCVKPVFNSVQEGSVVIVGRGFRDGSSNTQRYEHPSLASLIVDVERGPDIHDAASPTVAEQAISQAQTSRLGDIFEFRLGGVTGDCRYFLLTESQRINHGLPIESVTPVLTRSRQLTSAYATGGTWQALRAKDERVWLFRPSQEIAAQPPVSRYLSLGVDESGCDRAAYKVRNRDPWYQTPLPDGVDGFLSGMSRFGPWICLNDMATLNATNTLYVVRLRQPCSPDQRAAWALMLLTSAARRSFRDCVRRYPDGLLKYEPGDLANATIPTPGRVAGARAYYRATVNQLLRGDISAAVAKADAWLGTADNPSHPGE